MEHFRSAWKRSDRLENCPQIKFLTSKCYLRIADVLKRFPENADRVTLVPPACGIIASCPVATQIREFEEELLSRAVSRKNPIKGRPFVDISHRILCDQLPMSTKDDEMANGDALLEGGMLRMVQLIETHDQQDDTGWACSCTRRLFIRKIHNTLCSVFYRYFLPVRSIVLRSNGKQLVNSGTSNNREPDIIIDATSPQGHASRDMLRSIVLAVAERILRVC